MMKFLPQYSKGSEFHSSLRYLMIQYRWLGFFPVEGLGQQDLQKIRFNLRALYSVYYILSLIAQILLTAATFSWFLEKNMTLCTLANFVIHSSVLINTLCSIKLAKHWSKLVCRATELEKNLGDVRITKNITSKCFIMGHVVMVFALVEHFLSKVFHVTLVMLCKGETSVNTEVLEKYFHHKYYYIFDYIQLNPTTAFIAELTSLQAGYVLSFTDVLIMCISIYLTSYFNDLNKAIKSHQKKGIVPWIKIRVKHADLVILLKQIDSQLSPVVMMSFFSNLFFVCVQLFNILHRKIYHDEFCDPDGFKRAMSSSACLAYYLFSFTYLVMRALTLSYLAANVHKAAQGPLIPLFEAPTSNYNIEVQRFQLQLRYTALGLSGLFFYVTRKTILRLIGTVITYELIMLQFNKDASFLYSGPSGARSITVY